jgi:hypothetical protein
MKAQRGSGGFALISHQHLLGVHGQCHALANLPQKGLGTHCIGGWVGPRIGLDGHCQ